MLLDDKVDIIEESLKEYSKELLDILLKDRTTTENIRWATNDYIEFGPYYTARSQIQINQITGRYSKVIQPRVTKRSDQQNLRTREKAEVFTPSWICNEQNNAIDEQWFGYPNVFNIQKDYIWIATDKVLFPKDRNYTWKDYIDAKRIEVSCGEAPYLVSRYDSVNGNYIEIKNRIGLLDRKLRVVTENAANEEEWLNWAYRAYESIYGFELQGDNLLLARENLLYTFIDNVRYALKRTPTLEELKIIANIISWNIWQMDGLTCEPPFYGDMRQLSIFDNLDDIDISKSNKKGILCKIKDWRSKSIVEYYSLIKVN